jgi:multiple sugar transport system substrate-binding protein
MKKQVKLWVSLLLISILILSGCSEKVADTANGAVDSETQTDKDDGKSEDASSTSEVAAEAEATPEKVEKVKITFWHNYGADVEAPYFEETILPMFHEQYPNIEVEVIAQGNDQYRESIVISAGTGTTPDVARLDLSDISGLAKMGALLPLEDMAGFDELSQNVFKGPLSTNLYQGQYYGLPLDTNCKTAVFNMNTLNEIGLSEVPTTMEAFIEASRSAGKPTISVSSAGEWDFMPYFWLFGGVITDESFAKATGYLDSQASIDAMKDIVALHDEGILTIKEIDGTVDAWDGIKSGEYATFFEGPWFFAFTSDWKELNLKPAVIPSYKGVTTSVVGGESIGIFSTSEHTEETFKFVQFLLSEEVQVLMGKEMGQMPVLKAAASNEEFNSDEVWSVYLEQLNTAQTRVPSPESPVIQVHLKDAFDSILRGEISVEEGLSEAATLIDEALAEE